MYSTLNFVAGAVNEWYKFTLLKMSLMVLIPNFLNLKAFSLVFKINTFEAVGDLVICYLLTTYYQTI